MTEKAITRTYVCGDCKATLLTEMFKDEIRCPVCGRVMSLAAYGVLHRGVIRPPDPPGSSITIHF